MPDYQSSLVHMRGCVWEIVAASIAAEVEGVGGQPVSAQTHTPHLHHIGLHDCRPEESLF